MSDYERMHPTDILEQLRIRYEAIALVANVMREIEEYRIEHGEEADTTPILHLAEMDTPPPEVLAAIHEFNYQLLNAERSIETWFQEHGGAASLSPSDAEHARPPINRTTERKKVSHDAGGDSESNKARAPDALYWRAYTEMRAAYARIYPFQQMDPPFEHEDVEWACAESLAKLGPIMQEVQDAKGTCRNAIERALELAGALLLGMRSLALVLRSPDADWRGEIHTDDVDFPADDGIGWLLMLLDELASEGVVERWMSEDERGLEPGGICGAEGGSVSQRLTAEDMDRTKADGRAPERTHTTEGRMTERDETFPDDDELTPETAEAAMRLLVRDVRDQAEAERRIREILVEEYGAAGRIPKWLIATPAKKLPDDVNDGQ